MGSHATAARRGGPLADQSTEDGSIMAAVVDADEILETAEGSSASQSLGSADTDVLEVSASTMVDSRKSNRPTPGEPVRLVVEPGEMIGRFRVVRKLGEGGMAVVYEAVDTELDRRIAIKLLRPVKQANGLDGNDYALREAQAMAKLSHPNVIPVHDVGLFTGRLFLAMEYVEGKTMKEWLHEKRPFKEVLNIFIQCAEGLIAAHEAGMVHRDFKPDNVMIGNDGRARIMDLGLARYSYGGEQQANSGKYGENTNTPPVGGPDGDSDPDTGSVNRLNLSMTRTGAVLGTPLYMAPEQHLGKKVDARADQYAFCVAFHEAVYGRRPFNAKNYSELMEKVLYAAIEKPTKEEVGTRPRGCFRCWRGD